MSELVEYLASYAIRRLPTDEILVEVEFAKQEQSLSDNLPYKEYQAKRIKALRSEIDRRRSLQQVVKQSAITLDFIQDLKRRIDIRDIFNWMGILVRPNGTHRETYTCPAHPDKHPSGVIYVDDQQYHCFQCGAHGDVFDCLMAFRGMTFMQAVDTVAGYLGIELPKNAVRGFPR